MGEIAAKAGQVWRDDNIDGAPSSGSYDSPKAEVRAAFGVVEDEINAAISEWSDPLDDISTLANEVFRDDENNVARKPPKSEIRELFGVIEEVIDNAVFAASLPISPEARTIVMAMFAAGAPQALDRILLIDQTIRALVDRDVWDSLEQLVLIAGAGSAAQCIDWRVPSRSLTPVGPVSFLRDQGALLTLQSTQQYLRSNFTPSVDATIMTSTSLSLGVLIGSNQTNAAYAGGCLSGGKGFRIRPRGTDNVFSASLNANARTVASQTDSRGFWLASRSGSTWSMRHDDTVLDTTAGTSPGGSLPDDEIIWGTYNNEGTPAATSMRGLIPAVVIGAGLTDQQQHDLWDIIVNIYMAGLPATSFSDAELLDFASEATAYSAAIAASPNTTALRPWEVGYPVTMSYGQSQAVEAQAGVSPQPPIDPNGALMIGDSVRGGNTSGPSWTALTDSNLKPAAALNQLSGAPYTVRTGTFPGLNGVTVNTTTRTIATTSSVNFASSFQAGDLFAMTGFTGGASANNNGDAGHEFPIFRAVTVGAQSMTYDPVQPVSLFVPVAVSPGQNGIDLVHVEYNASVLGGSGTIAMTSAFRDAQIDADFDDPASEPILGSCGVSGQTIAALSKGNITGYYGRTTSFYSLVAGKATAASRTAGLAVCAFYQGSGDAGIDTSYVDYKTGFTQMTADIIADAMSGFTQAKPPLFLYTQLSGTDLSDGPASDPDHPMAVAMAHYDVMLNPPTPDVVCVGPAFGMPDHGTHFTQNGYNWWAEMNAKVWEDIVINGIGWKPMHALEPKWRGTTIVVPFHVPVPPIVARSVLKLSTPTTYTDWGFKITDDEGAIPVTSVEISNDVLVVLRIQRDVVGTPKVWLGDKESSHGGHHNIADSDTRVSRVSTFSYVAGSGQPPAENAAGLTHGQSFPLWNRSMVFCLPAVKA